MKRLILALCLVFAAKTAEAQNVKNDLIGLAMKPEIADYIAQIIPESGNQAVLYSPTKVAISAGAARTPNAIFNTSGLTFNSTGMNVVLAAYVPTMVATPVAGTNQIVPGLNVVPTAAANAAAIMGPSTPIPGQQFRVVNSGANSVRIKAGGGATLNGATAGGYITLATLASLNCFTSSATNYQCEQPVIPTPAGP